MWQSVEGMKVVCHELAQASNDPEESAIDELVKDSDGLVSCLANKVCLTNFLLHFVMQIDHNSYIFIFLLGCQDF